MSAGRQLPRWPLVLIAAPAAVAVWSGWVGLGGLCGFGLVQPLPGIVAWHLDTAITLPVGVEAYGAYALGAWLTPGAPERARAFARRSAVGALALGMLGQVVYHLLAAAHRTRAPWPVVVLVACLPVMTLGFGAGLTHLLRAEIGTAVPDPEDVPAVPEPEHTGVPVPVPVPAVPAPSVPVRGHGLNGHGHEAERVFADELAAGDVPAIRRIREQMHVGGPRAKQIQDHLAGCTPAGRSLRRARAEMRQHADQIRQGAAAATAGMPSPEGNDHDE